MAGVGDLYLVETRAAVEVTPGTAITTMTRRMYLDAVTFNPVRASRPITVQTGTRQNRVGHTQGPFQVAGSFSTPLSPAELIEILMLGLNGSPTITTPMSATLTRDRVFLPGALASATFEYFDAAQGLFRIAGVRVNDWTFTFTVDGGATFSGNFFATDHQIIGALTGSVTARVPTILDGWQGTYEMANFGSSSYTSFADLVMGGSVNFNNNLGRVYTLRNSLAAKRVSVGVIDASHSITFDAADAQAASELTNWRTDVKKVLRLVFTAPANSIETGFAESITFELPGAWTSPNLGGATQGTRSWAFPMVYVLDPNLGGGIKVTVRSGRANSAAFTNA